MNALHSIHTVKYIDVVIEDILNWTFCNIRNLNWVVCIILTFWLAPLYTVYRQRSRSNFIESVPASNAATEHGKRSSEMRRKRPQRIQTITLTSCTNYRIWRLLPADASWAQLLLVFPSNPVRILRIVSEQRQKSHKS